MEEIARPDRQTGKQIIGSIVRFFVILVAVQVPMYIVGVALEMAGLLNPVQRQLIIDFAQMAGACVAWRLCLAKAGLPVSTVPAVWQGVAGLPIGVCIGAAVAWLVQIIAYNLRLFTITGVNPVWDGWYVFVNLCLTAASEEIFFRGFVFRILRTWTGTGRAMLLSSLLFAAFHFLNDGLHPTLVYMAAQTLHILPIGLLLAALYVVSKRLWLPIGFHFAWDMAMTMLTGFAPAHLPTLVRATWHPGSTFENMTLLVTLPACGVACVAALRRDKAHTASAR